MVLLLSLNNQRCVSLNRAWPCNYQEQKFSFFDDDQALQVAVKSPFAAFPQDSFMSKAPVTQAIRVLREHQVNFSEHPYKYEEKGGTRVSARELGVDEHCVIKTLIMEDDRKQAMIVLMHGDREVSTRNLARQIGAKHVEPCDPKTADRHSGYQVGGTSPFGTRHPMPVYMEAAIADLPLLYINGGKRGFLIGMTPQDLICVLQPVAVEIAV
jgi:Cys-tRNA(Pro) deacylase